LEKAEINLVGWSSRIFFVGLSDAFTCNCMNTNLEWQEKYMDIPTAIRRNCLLVWD
jgi:hypothetical protein